MPFFMFLSGFIYFYTYKPVRTLHDYGRYAVRKFGASRRRTCCLAA